MKAAKTVPILRVVTESGRTVSCDGCAHLEKPSSDDDGTEVYGRCTFHDMVWESRKGARENGCMFWCKRVRRRGR